MIAMEKYGRKVTSWDSREFLNFPKPIESELKRMYRYTEAKAAHDVRYADIIEGRRVGITDRMVADIKF